MAMTSMDGRDSDGDGRRDGDGNGWRNSDGDGEVTKLMDSTVATAVDGVTATRWQQKAQWQRNGNDFDGLHGGKGNGRRNGDGDGRCDNEVVVMTVLDGATATAITLW